MFVKLFFEPLNKTIEKGYTRRKVNSYSFQEVKK